MSAYLVVEIEITDPATYETYIDQVPGIVYAHGGRYVTRTSQVIPLGGGWAPDRVVIIELPGLEELGSFAQSAEHQVLARLREQSTRTRSIALPGLDAQP